MYYMDALDFFAEIKRIVDPTRRLSVHEVIKLVEEKFTSTNKTSTPCKCVVKQTQVSGMGIIYAQRECHIHGHLHGSHC